MRCLTQCRIDFHFSTPRIVVLDLNGVSSATLVRLFQYAVKYPSPRPLHKEPLVFLSLILERMVTVMQKPTENLSKSMSLGAEYQH